MFWKKRSASISRLYWLNLPGLQPVCYTCLCFIFGYYFDIQCTEAFPLSLLFLFSLFNQYFPKTMDRVLVKVVFTLSTAFISHISKSYYLNSFSLWNTHLLCFSEIIIQSLSIIYWNECLYFWTANKHYFFVTNKHYFFLVCLVLFETGSRYLVMAILELTLYSRVALNKQGYSYIWYYLQCWDWKHVSHIWHKKIIFKVQKSNIGTCVFFSQLCLMDYFNNLGMNTTYSPTL